MSFAIVCVQPTHVARLCALLAECAPGLTVTGVEGHKDALLLRGTDVSEALAGLRAKPFVARVLRQEFPVLSGVTIRVPKGDEPCGLAAAAVGWQGPPHRLLVWPPVLLRPVGERLASCGVTFHPKRFAFIIVVVVWDRGHEWEWCVDRRPCAEADSVAAVKAVPAPVAVVGVEEGEDGEGSEGEGEGEEGIPCRAFHKIEEVEARFGHQFPPWWRDSFCDADTAPRVAVDVGASPGGWTLFLSSRCTRVYAIDPGDLVPSVAALPNVTHMRARVEPLGPDGAWPDVGVPVRALGGPFGDALPFISLLTCDAIMEPALASQLLCEFTPWLLPGALLVFTVKTRQRREEAQGEAVAAALALVRTHFPNATSTRLFSNRREHTVVGTYSRAELG